MGLATAADNITAPNLDIVTLPHIPPLRMERHNMVIHILHTATPGKGYQEPRYT
jgi:hypothetical protein